MMQEFFKYQVVSRLISKIPPSIPMKLTRVNTVILYYHMVSDDATPHVQHLYEYKNVDQFKDDIDSLLRTYSPISLLDFVYSLKSGSPLPENTFLLTFDDGFREMHDVVAPILLEKGVTATFFVNSDFIDNKALCYQHKASILADLIQKKEFSSFKEDIKESLLKNRVTVGDFESSILSIKYPQKGIIDEISGIMGVDFDDYLLTKKPYLTSTQIKTLIGEGFSIGAHSKDHPLYSLLSLRDQLYQTTESLKFLKDHFSLDYGAFAFPHSDNNVSTEFFLELYKTGLVDVSFGTRGMINDTFSRNFQRVSLEKPLMPAQRIISYQFVRKLFRTVKGTDEVVRE